MHTSIGFITLQSSTNRRIAPITSLGSMMVDKTRAAFGSLGSKPSLSKSTDGNISLLSCSECGDAAAEPIKKYESRT